MRLRHYTFAELSRYNNKCWHYATNGPYGVHHREDGPAKHDPTFAHYYLGGRCILVINH